MKQEQIKEIKITELKPAGYNPRSLSKTQYTNLKESLTRFGFVDPIIVNQHPDRQNVIVGGHMRAKVWGDMGHETVPCIYVALSETKEKELNIRLNKNTGEWDWEILANEFDMDELMDWGFDEKDLLGHFTMEAPETKGDDDVPDVAEDTETVQGDVYELGSHRLMCGDGTNRGEVNKLLKGSIPILMVTDPPYGVNYEPEWRGEFNRGETAIGKVTNDDRVDWTDAYQLFTGDTVYIWHASNSTDIVKKNIQDAGFEIINQIIWAKQHFCLSRGDYHWQHEPCWYAVRKGKRHHWQGKRDQSTLWQISNNNPISGSGEPKTGHSTQKPVQCMEKPILNNSSKGESVYDPFSGSGTTLIACEKQDRQCLMIEIEPKYCDVIVKRYIEFCGGNNRELFVKKNGMEVNPVKFKS